MAKWMQAVLLMLAAATVVLAQGAPGASPQPSATSTTPPASAPTDGAAPPLSPKEAARQGIAIKNATVDCQVAVFSDDVQAQCSILNPPEGVGGNKGAEIVCSAPACTDTQIYTALNILSNKCKQEIEKQVPTVLSIFSQWYTHNLRRGILCAKDPADGSYCIAKPRQDDQEVLQCSECMRTQLNVYSSWKMPEGPRPTNNPVVQKDLTPPSGLSEACKNQSANGPSSSSAVSAHTQSLYEQTLMLLGLVGLGASTLLV
ncbi:hypothetical protein THASP1DRAFT_29399 [Thamnocephalis sphaerospora]|uniref:Uncharacterized protein n=1 Tax=Thamnocephalis sphaerospora TaxID=78915 RepID=A0A4P9XRT9_9FUNG|nr:hypothetical protein THASP1DRAFT_29399 [Thamnocephalis sphaerospora]|eukprot:RKP08798.1 hypothetical protein THASP1DRAFT_29399 [Thamnocephalis sphaerospora]